MFYVFIYIFVSDFYLWHQAFRVYIVYSYGFVFLRIACGNDNCHSRYEEKLQEFLKIRMNLSGHKLSGCFNEGIVYLVMVFLPLLMTMPL